MLINPRNMKRKTSDASSQSDSDSNDSNSDSSDSDSNDVVNVDFDFFPPKEIDFLGLKTLVNQLLPHTEIPSLNMSALVDLIIKQEKIGTTVKVADETDPYAVLTCMDLHMEELGPVKDYLVGKGGDEFKKLVKGKVGFVVNERLINMPPQIAPPMFNFLLEEVKPLKYTHYVYLSKTYTEVTERKGSTDKDSKKAKRDILHVQAEDEVLADKAMFKKAFHLSKDKSKNNSFDEFGIESSRLLLVLDDAKFKSAGKEMSSFIGTI
jgi:protein BCP1